jgi:hypothetical protein
VAATLRGSGIVGALVVCVFAGAKLFSFAASPGGIGHAAAIGKVSHAPRPGRKHAGSGHRVSPSASAPATPTPTASPTPAPTQSVLPDVSGDEVTAVGDSVMVAATPALEQDLPGIYIDAQVGRQFYTGLQVIDELKAEGKLRKIVVVGLGTNGTVTSDEISQLFAEIGPDRLLVLVNTFEDRSWEQEVNSTLAAAAADHPSDVVLANWYTTIEHRTDLLWPDGIHPQPSGGVVYGAMLKRAVDQVASLPG